jgi:hypothetical protein
LGVYKLDLTTIPWVPAKGFTRGTPSVRRYDLIVIHTIEAPESNGTAEGCARYFQTTDRQVSSHYCVDADSVVQCVRLDDVAWCAPGANHNGIHIEHAGYAKQNAADWADVYSQAMLSISAQLVAALVKKYDIPIAFVDAPSLVRGVRGITTHDAVSRAFKRSNHWDPGVDFPMESYLSLVRKHSNLPVDDVSAKPWPIPVPKWFWGWARWRLSDRDGQRPADAPKIIPQWAWRRLEALVAGRRK